VSRDIVLTRPAIAPHHNRPGVCPVRGERINEIPVVVEPTLRHPDRFRGHRRRESGDDAERAQHIVGSDRRADLPYDRHQYPIRSELIGRRRQDGEILDVQRGDRRPRIQRSPSVLGDAFDQQFWDGEQRMGAPP
jgi:hypothetical protein